jgi:hypothetical protein
MVKCAAGILEEVHGFQRKFRSGIFADITPLDKFEAEIRSICGPDGLPLYTGFVAMELDAASWIDVARPRTLAAFCHLARGIMIW